MGIATVYREVMDRNRMADKDDKEAAARAFFEKLNAMDLPEHFNWADEIFEGLHVKKRGDNTALNWADNASGEKRNCTDKQFAAQGNQCLNALRAAEAVWCQHALWAWAAPPPGSVPSHSQAPA